MQRSPLTLTNLHLSCSMSLWFIDVMRPLRIPGTDMARSGLQIVSDYLLLPTVVLLVAVAGAAAQAPSGTIEGKVSYTGTPPKMRPIDMSKEPTCQKEHNPPALSQNVVTGPGNGLQYAVVY